MSSRDLAKRRAIARAIASKKAAAGAPKVRRSAAPPRARPMVVGGRGAYYRKSPPAEEGSIFKPQGYGARLGAVVGEGLHGLFKAITGYGEYSLPLKPNKNSLLYEGNDPPEVRNAADGRFIIRHREYVQDIITGAPGVFTNQSFRINPGDPNTFPWLSTVAQCFEEYQIRGMLFEFKSTSGDSLTSTNTALGTCIMATQYDAAKSPFTTKSEMENHQYSASAKQSVSTLHAIECAPRASVLPQLYVRAGATPAGTDPRLYDFGLFQIATEGQQGTNVNIGELHVTYEIELYKPQLNPAVISRATTDHYQMSADFDNTNTLSLSPVKVAGSSANSSISSGNYLYFDPDKVGVDWIVHIQWLGTGPVSWNGPLPVLTNCTLVTVWNGDSENSGYAPNGGVTTSRCCVTYKIRTLSTNAYVIIAGAPVLPTTPISGDVWVISADPDVVTIPEPVESKIEKLERQLAKFISLSHQEPEDRPKDPSQMTDEQRAAEKSALIHRLMKLGDSKKQS